jgi:hypothetical protein
MIFVFEHRRSPSNHFVEKKKKKNLCHPKNKLFNPFIRLDQFTKTEDTKERVKKKKGVVISRWLVSYKDRYCRNLYKI